MTTYENESVHDAVGAYVLGILDDADATAFEMHLVGCSVCAAHLDEFAGMEPMLAMLAEAPGPAAQPVVLPMPDPVPAAGFSGAPPGSGPPLIDRLVDEVAAKRAQRRRRTRLLVALAAALVIGGPVAAVVTTSRDDAGTLQALDPHPTSPAEDAFFHHMQAKVQATDASTKVSATIGMESKGWGTHAVLELKNVKGPLKCNLVAVSKTGEEEVVTSWAVPKWGYGIPDSPDKMAKNPLYIHGGVSMNRSDIDHFEVRTFEGKRLVEVDA
ncbi:anti-sigma factor family protein [Streptomyces sp. SP18CS02]|uniref:anti-sigma factor family protein n=1 Tax=Streptomyces sp. SP18CS02 TaxID=3002531 RepID=UPI002E791663|nr:zf-HC2 domain-containing protein [Streptomyces sp. SP18CS02]MEE1752241.1 zf-HC2 domain-containing protein [Streptomyces sp. SP18CS02]